MRSFSVALVLCVAAARCGGDRPGATAPGEVMPDSTTHSCTDVAECPFGEICRDGMCTLDVVDPIVDEGCEGDADCGAGQLCATSSGLCVPEAETPAVTELPPPECELGQRRACGTKVGACRYGVETCVAGGPSGSQWGGCEGAVGPLSTELCNGLDDDCDGIVPIDERDLDGDGVRGCDGDCDDEDPTVHPGLTEVCDGKDNDCSGTGPDHVDEGTDPLCDDGAFCNGTEACVDGACRARDDAPDCSGLDEACRVGSCDEQLDGCTLRDLSDGTDCDDGDLCSVGSTCAGGICSGGAPRDCSGVADACNTGRCEPTDGSCVPEPVSDDTPCTNGEFCTVGQTCQAGQCTGGNPRNCDAPGSCRGGPCNESLDICEGAVAINEGLPCDDGDPCTESTTCTAGDCGGGGPKDCSGVADGCHEGVCEAGSGSCQRVSKAPGTGCDDGVACTDGDACQPDGTCRGALRDCSGLDDVCADGACVGGTCVAQAKADGTGCDDGRWCTLADRCESGACTGNPRDCGGVADACNDAGCDDDVQACVPVPLSGTPCDDGEYCSDGDTCQGGDCSPGGPRDCSAVADACNDGVCDEFDDICVAVDNGQCNCDTSDDDYDGQNECDGDCDDADGSIFDGAAERCNGIDDDCDGDTDEDFDADGDGWSLCAIDPAERDCDDSVPTINPGADELCGASGAGNGVDEDCDGYTDELCTPCDTVDDDGDGFSECEGDCDDAASTVFPGAPEQCDGIDSDCNTFTTEHCEVSERCNWPGDADVCRPGLTCSCLLDRRGICQSNYRCTSYCNTSQTGTVGDGCAADETCLINFINSANIHGCYVDAQLATTNTKRAGVACAKDSECRSNVCQMLFTGNESYCWDTCASDAYCASSAVCRPRRTATEADPICWPSGRPGLGPDAVGTPCTSDSQCDHGFCGTFPTTSACTEPCCNDTDCPDGFGCSLQGDQFATAYVLPVGPSCAVDDDCPTGMECFTSAGLCAWRVAETTPMCRPDDAGQGDRPGGAACATNADCRGGFCERDLGICIEVCCNDLTCPQGLGCELQFVQTTSDHITTARVCMNQSVDTLLLRR